jgi:pyrroline-5-carboxylate reductase
VEKIIGFIGSGNIAEAIIKGFYSSRELDMSKILIFDENEKINVSMKEKYNVLVSRDCKEIAKKADILLVAVKPNQTLSILKDISSTLNRESIVVSIAAGINLNALSEALQIGQKIVRAIPNIASMVREGMTSICNNDLISREDLNDVFKLFNKVGKVLSIPEEMMHVAIGISSSSPAYVFSFIEAMVEAAISYGMTKELAYQLASQAVKGAAKTLIEIDSNVTILKDMVSSPKGTTMEAMKVLDNGNFKGLIKLAVEKCVRRSVMLGKK